MELFKWFTDMPTGGKIAVAAGGGAILLFVWQPWKSSSAASTDTFSPAYGTGTPDTSSGGNVSAAPQQNAADIWGAMLAANPGLFTPVTPVATPLPDNLLTSDKLTSILNGLHLVSQTDLTAALASKVAVVPAAASYPTGVTGNILPNAAPTLANVVPSTPATTYIPPAQPFDGTSQTMIGASPMSTPTPIIAAPYTIYREIPPAVPFNGTSQTMVGASPASTPTPATTTPYSSVTPSFSGTTGEKAASTDAAYVADPTLANQKAAEEAYRQAAWARDEAAKAEAAKAVPAPIPATVITDTRSSQKKYLDGLVESGTPGNKSWAAGEIAAGRY